MAITTGFTRRKFIKQGSVILAAPAILRATTVGAQGAPFKIGIVSPQTGPLSGFGEAEDFVLNGLADTIAGITNNGAPVAIANSFDAQYGRTSGGIVNVQIKSGTNTYHGSLYEFYRRNWLDANSVLANTAGRPKGKTLDPNTGKFVAAEHFLDQYGGVLDGPVRLPKSIFRKLGYDGRDKTFFLFNYEGYREGTPNPAVRTVPTEAFLKGDFSNYKTAAGALITVYDPATGRNDANGQKSRRSMQRSN